MPEDDTPGGRIRRARLEKNMLLVDLAAATGLSVRSLRLAEQNKSTVSPPNLRRLSEALAVPIAYLGCFENLPEQTLGQRIKKARLYHGYNKREFGGSICLFLFEIKTQKIKGTLQRLYKFIPILKREMNGSDIDR
ncbi:helix-turn-helix domain-containing protein [Brevibacillus sp. WF146]|uniref:helix-turn-helix domain-containing protein n=1 Tax=Brevibacillus sp. WF146 TaxID=319501 RepID=UPI002100310F|nr:helix-turn-helix transcriptional regulator [Brevibacillus sp. WF146]UYZ15190.1 helix-turn-helix domain-containing protein [Brevibacillus sp. WF146]